MGLTSSVTQRVQVAEGMALAMASDCEVSVWPAGLGAGPVWQMSFKDWETIKASVDAAIQVARTKQLREFRAAEGNGDYE